MLDWLLPSTVAAASAMIALGLYRRLLRVRGGLDLLRKENEQLTQRIAGLSSALHARSRFLAMMSHEIRTPLTGIVGFAEVLAEEPMNAEGRRSLENIRRASRSLQALLGDILDFSRIDAGALPMLSRPTDIEALLLEVRDEFAPQVRQRGLDFGVSISGDARRWTETDPLRLRQIIVNLLSNAIRYTESGMIRISATTLAGDPDTVVFRVSDTGLGIAPEDCVRIFDAFAQAAEGQWIRSEDGGGVGLGLAIADGLVRAMGGTLTLESTPGRGSTFTASLPLPACPRVAAAPEPVTTAAPARILLVDDVAMNRELFAGMLAKAGHRVITAPDGEAALRCLRDARFDLAFIDIQMPGIDGLELTRRIRGSADPGTAALPIVALSASAYGDDHAKALAAGMNDYVTKPATREDIAAAVARIQAGPAADASAQARPPARPEVLDRRIFEAQRSTFGNERTAHFLTLLEDEMERRSTALAAAADRDDRDDIGRHAHSVASAAGNLGFAQLVAIGRRIEGDVAALPPDRCAAAVDELQDAVAVAIETARALRTEILQAHTAGHPDEPRATG